MLVLGIMCLGIFAGNRFVSQKQKEKNEKLQALCTVLLIFSMGVTLGKRENFFQDLFSLGLRSFLFFIVPTGLSLVLVYFLTQRFMNDKDAEEKNKKESTEAERKVE